MVVVDRCPCGRHWNHEADTAEGRLLSEAADRLVERLGPTACVTVSRRSFVVPRCFIARHRFTGAELLELGFPEAGAPGFLVFPELPAITCARCGTTSRDPDDVAGRRCCRCGASCAG